MKKVANRFIAVALLLAFSLTTVGCGAKVNKGTSDSESGVTSESTGTAINDNSNPQDDNVPAMAMTPLQCLTIPPEKIVRPQTTITIITRIAHKQIQTITNRNLI